MQVHWEAFLNLVIQKKYIHDAGNWLAEHIPNDAKLYSNELLVMYYANRKNIYDNNTNYKDIKQIENVNWQQYQYIAIRLDKKDLLTAMPFIQQMDDKPIRIFANKRGDQVRIYKSSQL